MPRRVLGVALLLCLGWSSAELMQVPAYAGQAEDMHYTSANAYFLWFLQGADTLGQPAATQTKETHRLFEQDTGLRLDVVLEGVGEPAFSSSTSFRIDRTGRVLTVDGLPPGESPGARIDVLPRVGATDGWIDTVSVAHTHDYGETFYRAERQYRHVGEVDLEGVEVALFVASGRLSLRQGGWQDANQTISWWQEVSGPVVDSVWFDSNRGRLVQSSSVMHLEGVGGFAQGGQTVEMPSGLRSSVRRTPEGG